jgi:hypothetical protein
MLQQPESRPIPQIPTTSRRPVGLLLSGLRSSSMPSVQMHGWHRMGLFKCNPRQVHYGVRQMLRRAPSDYGQHEQVSPIKVKRGMFPIQP